MAETTRDPFLADSRRRDWGVARGSMYSLLAAMVGIVWVFGKVAWMYQTASSGRWVPLASLRQAVCGGTAGLGVAVCLVASVAFAAVACVRSAGRPRWAGIVFLCVNVPMLAVWGALLVAFWQGSHGSVR